MKMLPAVLALEDGSVFHGITAGHVGEAIGEVVFNTSMTGYQEILTDPSYAKQMITFSYPHLGNVGVNPQDQESHRVWASGLILRDISKTTSSWRATQSLYEYLCEHDVVAIADIDTRRLTRIIRDKGALRGCIIAGEKQDAPRLAIEKAKSVPLLQGVDLAKMVSTSKQYKWKEGIVSMRVRDTQPLDTSYHVVVYDYGVKRNILRLLVEAGCSLTVVPAQTPVEDVMALNPDGVFLSNGPGDPSACDYAVRAIEYLLEKSIPLFGICLGFQLLALACGAKTYKMKFGHHGANHPVQSLAARQVAITSQNHGFAVDTASLPDTLEITHIALFDNTLQGIRHKSRPAFGFQGHPEASPGPHDLQHLFDHFASLMQSHQKHKAEIK